MLQVDQAIRLYQDQDIEQYRSRRQPYRARKCSDRIGHKRYRRPRRRQTIAMVRLRRAIVVAGAMSLLWGVSYKLTFQEATPLVQSHDFVASLPSPDLKTEAQELFAHPDSIGAIALGVAEGTRTIEGGRTSSWNSHIDAGNGAINQGTFAWQMEVSSPEEADQAAIRHIQKEVIPHILQNAEQEGITVEPEVLVQAVDLWNQAP